MGRNNLTIRKIYGKDQIRYLRCRCCGAEFSERKNTALWNTKVPEEKAVSVAEHLAEGCSLKATARLAKVHPSGVTRLNRKAGHHAEAFHDQRVVEVAIRYAHGSRRCVQRVLEQLGYTTPNTSAIERRNGTARRMNAHQVRRALAFSRRDDTKIALGWWGLTVYNGSRPHRSLRRPLLQPEGKKSLPLALRLWR